MFERPITPLRLREFQWNPGKVEENLMDMCDRYEKLVEAAERVAEVVRREERRARDAQDFPFAKDPSQSAQWHERERARRLMRQAASLAEAERRTDETN